MSRRVPRGAFPVGAAAGRTSVAGLAALVVLLAVATSPAARAAAVAPAAPDSAAGPATSGAAVGPPVAAGGAAGESAAGEEPIHPSLLPDLGPETTFPRLTPQELLRSGYPDHLHTFGLRTPEPLVDADGRTYGPGSLCRNRVSRPREGLEIGEGRIRYGPFDLTFNAQYEPCDMLPFLEYAELGLVRARQLFGLQPTDTLRIVNPDNRPAYVEGSGQGVWRTYKLMGDSVFVQPIPILMARTLIGHTAATMAVRWALRQACGDALPPWLEHGLALYLADMGYHLNNYMDEFRQYGDILVPVVAADALLSEPPRQDEAEDRQLFRRAQYVAFLMVWRLVEDEGGAEPVRRLLAAVAAGEDPDAAARDVYGTDLAGLAERVDPNRIGEPITSNDPYLQPNRAP